MGCQSSKAAVAEPQPSVKTLLATDEAPKTVASGGEAPTSVSDTSAMSDDHLTLGITCEGFRELLRRICFPVGEIVDSDGNKKVAEGLPHQLEAMKEFPYKRGEDLQWCNDIFGEQLTGYDVAEHICIWLRDNGHQERSMCEVLRNEGNPHIGKANVFLSHAQMKPIEYTLNSVQGVPNYLERAGKPVPDKAFYWLDYAVLRQCQDDFDLPAIQKTIHSIGCTVVEVDDGKPKDTQDWSKGFNIEYFARTFCIFELFCSVEGDCHLVLMVKNAGSARKILTVDIDAEQAQSRDPAAKKLIDDWIKGSTGFEKVNAACFHALKTVGKTYGFGDNYFSEENSKWFSPGYLTCEKYYQTPLA